MEINPRRIAPFGLVLSGLAVLTAIFFAALKGIAATGLYLPQNPDLLDRGLYGSGIAFVLGLAIFALLDPERMRTILTGRQARFGSNSLILMLASFGVILIANIWVYQNPQRWDVTEDKQRTLAPETIATLQSLKEPVFATAFFTARIPTTQARQLLEDSKNNSNGKFDFQFIDPELNPVAAQQAGITRDGTIVIQTGAGSETLDANSEQGLVTALIKLISPETRTVYFLTGHGERSIDTSGELSYTQIKRALEGKNYTVKALNLRAENQVPADALAVIVVGPLEPVSLEETRLIANYLQQGGSLVYLSEPRPLTNFGEKPDPLSEMLALEWGIALNDDIVLDPSANPPLVAVSNQYNAHPITNRLGNILTLFPTVRSLSKVGELENIQSTDLVVTIDRAWGETDISALENNQAAFDSNDLAGPITMAVAASNQETSARVVVIGDADFAQDAYSAQYGNSDFLVNSIDWAAEQENLINLTPRQRIERVYSPPGTTGLVAILLSSACLIPLIVIASGITVWIWRRRRG